MKKTLQLGLLLLGALALSFTFATADGKCGDAKKVIKCDSGKCGTDGNSANAEKKVPTKGKCGQGKCG